MDFEPFHSDEDEELASIMPEKKKKDGEKWKKSKGGPLFRNEKKMTYNDIHSPPGVKGKHSVHGVVGPAEYISDQANSPPPEPVPTLLSQALTHSSIVVSSSEILSLGGTLVNASARVEALPQPVPNPVLPQKPAARPELSQPPTLSQAQQKQIFSNHHSSQTPFQANFPPVASMPAKIDRDRPHCSPAVMPQIPQVPQGPTPFKHQPQANVQVRPAALSQTMATAQFQLPSSVQQPPMQVTAGNHTPYHRNQYNMTVSASKPISIPEPHTPDFATYENVCDRSLNTSQDSSVPENAESVPRGTMSSPISPFGNDVVLEGNWPEVESKVPASDEYIDSEWATFRPAVNLQDPYDGDNDDNRRKSHGTDSLSESIPESMSSVESEQDDSVWKINTEQREYYTKQFKKIQPNIGEVIKGPQARDFFLKSNLPNETLSTIWQLSDMDKDAALNLNEFCIAMHLVVAVKHGVELPNVLPHTLIHPSGSFSEEPLGESQSVVEESDDENKNSSISDDASLSSSTEASSSNLVPDHSVRRSSSHDLENRDRTSSFGNDASDGSVSIAGPIYNTPIKDNVSAQTAIARPRASVQKNVNLMDASPWQLLPPPSSKGKPVVKKMLNMDDDAAFTSNESIEQVHSFSSPEQLTKNLSSVYNDNDTEYDSKTNNSQTKTKPRRLSKEKSRSIDSLRLDMNEDHASVEMRRISRDSRPRSFSGEGTHVNGSASNRISKEMEIPPIPPPRNKGHVRANSLDLNRIMDSKSNNFSGSQEIPTAAFRHTPPLDSSDVSTSGHPRKDVANGGIKIDDANLNIDPQEIHIQSSIMAHPPMSSHIIPRRGSAGDAVKHVVRFSDELDVLDDVISSNSIDKKMRKHELQARVRLLKSSNSTLSNLLAQLHMEWKSVSEERIALDILLQKEKQQDLS